MRNDFYVGIYEDQYLAHSIKGWTKKGHKYISRFFKNGRWQYVYEHSRNSDLSKNTGEKAYNKAGAAGRRAWGLVKKYGPTAVDLLTGRPSILNQTKKIYDNRDSYKEIYDDINKKRKVKQAKRKAKNKQQVKRNY